MTGSRRVPWSSTWGAGGCGRGAEAAKPVAVAPLVWPASDRAGCYGRPAARLKAFGAEHPGDPDAAAVADEPAWEIEVWQTCGESFASTFFTAVARP